jgi:hypothetical protein
LIKRVTCESGSPAGPEPEDPGIAKDSSRIGRESRQIGGRRSHLISCGQTCAGARIRGRLKSRHRQRLSLDPARK